MDKTSGPLHWTPASATLCWIPIWSPSSACTTEVTGDAISCDKRLPGFVDPSHSGLPFLLCVYIDPSWAGVCVCCWAGRQLMGKAHRFSAPKHPATSSLLLYGEKKGSAGIIRQHFRALHSAMSSYPRQDHERCHTSCQNLRFAEGHAA